MLLLKRLTRRAVLNGTALASVLIAGVAGAQSPELEGARAALAKAATARAEAQRALDAADMAIKAAQSAIEAATAPPQPLTTDEARVETLRPSLCAADASSAEAIARMPNDFQSKCLEMKDWTDFSVASLNAQVTVATANESVEIVPSYAIYSRPKYPREFYRATYWKGRIGVAVPLDKSGGKAATFADLTKVDAVNRVGYVFGFEWGRSPKIEFSKVQEGVAKALAAAQRACVSFHSADSFRLLGGAMSNPQASEIAIQKCSGAALTTWMKDEDRKHAQYQALIPALWGKDKKPEFYMGIEGRVFPPSGQYFALSDPAGTGIPTIEKIPVTTDGAIDLKKAVDIKRIRYSIKAYAGSAVKDTFGLGASLTYRREIAFPQDFRNKIVCGTPATVTSAPRCETLNIAAPYEHEGFVIGGRLAASFPRMLFLPKGGIDIRASYALDIDQFAVDVPVYLFSDSESATSGGVRLGCTLAGRLKSALVEPDFVLPGECRLSVFLGTKLDFNAVP